MEIDQGRYRDARRTKLHAHAGDRIQHPRRHDDNDTRCRLDMHEASALTVFTVVPAQFAAAERVPSIVNDDVPPDMGRMSG